MKARKRRYLNEVGPLSETLEESTIISDQLN